MSAIYEEIGTHWIEQEVPGENCELWFIPVKMGSHVTIGATYTGPCSKHLVPGCTLSRDITIKRWWKQQMEEYVHTLKSLWGAPQIWPYSRRSGWIHGLAVRSGMRSLPYKLRELEDRYEIANARSVFLSLETNNKVVIDDRCGAPDLEVVFTKLGIDKRTNSGAEQIGRWSVKIDVSSYYDWNAMPLIVARESVSVDCDGCLGDEMLSRVEQHLQIAVESAGQRVEVMAQNPQFWGV